MTFLTALTIAHQAPLSMGFPRQEYWSGLPFPSPGESSRPRDWTCISCIDKQILYQLNHQGSPYLTSPPKFPCSLLPAKVMAFIDFSTPYLVTKIPENYCRGRSFAVLSRMQVSRALRSRQSGVTSWETWQSVLMLMTMPLDLCLQVDSKPSVSIPPPLLTHCASDFHKQPNQHPPLPLHSTSAFCISILIYSETLSEKKPDLLQAR